MDCHSSFKFQKNVARGLNLKTFHAYIKSNSSIHYLIIVITIIIIIIIIIFTILDFMMITVAITIIITIILNIIATTAIIITIIIFINNLHQLKSSFLDDTQAKWLNHFLTLEMSSHRHKKTS